MAVLIPLRQILEERSLRSIATRPLAPRPSYNRRLTHQRLVIGAKYMDSLVHWVYSGSAYQWPPSTWLGSLTRIVKSLPPASLEFRKFEVIDNNGCLQSGLQHPVCVFNTKVIRVVLQQINIW